MPAQTSRAPGTSACLASVGSCPVSSRATNDVGRFSRVNNLPLALGGPSHYTPMYGRPDSRLERCVHVAEVRSSNPCAPANGSAAGGRFVYNPAVTGFVGLRLAQSVLALFAVTVLAFVLVYATGDPAEAVVPLDAKPGGVEACG